MRVRDAMRRTKIGRWRDEIAICVLDCLRDRREFRDLRKSEDGSVSL